MTNCQDLDPQSHQILAMVTQAGWRVKTGKARTTVSNLATSSGLPWRDVKTLLEDLEVLGFLELLPETSGIVVLDSCGCEDPSRVAKTAGASLPPRPTVNRPGAQRRGGNGRERKQAERVLGAEGPSRARVLGRARGVKGGLTVPATLNSVTLANFFTDSLRGVRMTPEGFGSVGESNSKALAANFARWMREDGVTPEQILAMIEIFVEDRRLLRESKPAWQIFLNSRHLLVQRASNRAARRASTVPAEGGVESPTSSAPIRRKRADKGGW